MFFCAQAKTPEKAEKAEKAEKSEVASPKAEGDMLLAVKGHLLSWDSPSGKYMPRKTDVDATIRELGDFNCMLRCISVYSDAQC